MAFSKIDYNSTEEIFDVKIEDGSGKVLDRWKFQKKDFPKWARIIANKYGINIKIKDISDLSWTDYS
ncbi:MAG TPA: hypothetical protein VMZ91_16025 [Candidatus Paceibacterota bacterium]|nr:hypothetical protein [Candidatus Paceibacterota bacterium]